MNKCDLWEEDVILTCPKCHKKELVIYGEGEHDGKHYPLEQCRNCGYGG